MSAQRTQIALFGSASILSVLALGFGLYSAIEFYRSIESEYGYGDDEMYRYVKGRFSPLIMTPIWAALVLIYTAIHMFVNIRNSASKLVSIKMDLAILSFFSVVGLAACIASDVCVFGVPIDWEGLLILDLVGHISAWLLVGVLLGTTIWELVQVLKQLGMEKFASSIGQLEASGVSKAKGSSTV